MKKNKPHGQWIALTALISLPPFGQDWHAIKATCMPRISGSGVRTRLKELEDIGLVQSFETKGSKLRKYVATEQGWVIWRAGVDGIEALRMMRAHHKVLEGQRAQELAPIKDKWDKIIRQRMRMVAQSVLTGASSPPS